MNDKRTDTIAGVIWFYVLAFGISWLVWSPLILFPQRSASLGFLVLAGSFGPMLAAGIAAWIEGGRAGCVRWLKSAFRWRIHFGWYLLGGLGGDYNPQRFTHSGQWVFCQTRDSPALVKGFPIALGGLGHLAWAMGGDIYALGRSSSGNGILAVSDGTEPWTPLALPSPTCTALAGASSKFPGIPPRTSW